MRLSFDSLRRHSALLALVAACALASCASSPPDAESAQTERSQRPMLSPELRRQINQWIQSSHPAVADAEVTRYLNSISARVYRGAAAPTFSDVPQIVILSNPSGKTQNFAVTGDRVYVSAGVLRELDYENEIAAVIAFEFSRAASRAFVERAAAPSPGGMLPFGTLYAYGPDEDLAAADDAVDSLYLAGYDPRGLVSYLDKLKTLGNRNSVLTPARIPAVQERARRAIAFHAPLKDPVIRTEEFFRLKKRMERL